MAIIGYARTSTTDQNIEPQLEALKTAGCERIFQEQRSGVDAARPELLLMLDWVRDGDTVICTKIDRIARSVKDLWNIIGQLQTKGVAFKALNNSDLNTSSATGKLMVSILGAVAEFEREMMLERQRDGIAAAKEAGKYKGRKATAMAQTDTVMELLGQGLTKQAVADRLGIGVASVYRVVKEAKK